MKNDKIMRQVQTYYSIVTIKSQIFTIDSQSYNVFTIKEPLLPILPTINSPEHWLIYGFLLKMTGGMARLLGRNTLSRKLKYKIPHQMLANVVFVYKLNDTTIYLNPFYISVWYRISINKIIFLSVSAQSLKMLLMPNIHEYFMGSIWCRLNGIILFLLIFFHIKPANLENNRSIFKWSYWITYELCPSEIFRMNATFDFLTRTML